MSVIEGPEGDWYVEVLQNGTDTRIEVADNFTCTAVDLTWVQLLQLRNIIEDRIRGEMDV